MDQGSVHTERSWVVADGAFTDDTTSPLFSAGGNVSLKALLTGRPDNERQCGLKRWAFNMRYCRKI